MEPLFDKKLGSTTLRNVLFVLFFIFGLVALYFYESDDLPKLGSETETLQKIERIKLGMHQMQVRSIVGGPTRSEVAPFPEESLPIKNPELLKSRKVEKLLLSTKRDVFQLKFADPEGNARAYDIEIYYDKYSTVCYIHYALYEGLVWDLVEMY